MLKRKIVIRIRSVAFLGFRTGSTQALATCGSLGTLILTVLLGCSAQKGSTGQAPDQGSATAKYIKAYQRGTELFEQARSSGNKRTYLRAARKFRKARLAIPDSTNPYLSEAYARINAGQRAEAIPLLKTYIEKANAAPKNARKILGKLYLAHDQPKAALRVLNKSIKIYPDDGELQNLRLNALARAGNTERAIEAYQQHITTHSEDATFQYNYGSLLLEADRYDEAAKQLKKAVEIDPDDPKKQYNLGAAYLKKGVAFRDSLVSLRDSLLQKNRNLTQEERQMVKELDQKRLQLFRKAIPPLKRARQLSDPGGKYHQNACSALFRAYMQTEQGRNAQKIRECASTKAQLLTADRTEKPQRPEKNDQVAPQLEEDPQSTDQNSESDSSTPSPPFPVDTQVPEAPMHRPNAIAVIIGNKTYRNSDIPNVDYAMRDAKIMQKYLTRTLGVQKENVIYVENATAAALTRIFGTADDPQGQLYNWVRPGVSEVFVYYSGHGAPNPESGQAYLIPSDANPNYLSQNGYPVQQLYENLSRVPAQSVTVVLEACFSGVSEGGAVVQRASPVELSVENPVMALDNGLAFTAGAADQIASWYPEKEHGLFTYFFLKGLRGAADRDGDRAVTGTELGQYVKNKVPYRARRMYNREQTPQVVGPARDRVLVRYEARGSQN